jgi:hypothetical protein
MASHHRDDDPGLIRRHVVDCTGRTTHRLVLRPDGMVEVANAHGDRAVIDPRFRVCVTPGSHVPDTLIDMAVSLISLS